MKKLLTILCITSLVASGMTWADHNNTEVHSSYSQSALLLKMPQKGHPVPATAQYEKQKDVGDPPAKTSQPLHSTENNGAWDPRCIEAIC